MGGGAPWPSTCLLRDRSLAIHARKLFGTPLFVTLPRALCEPLSALRTFPTGSTLFGTYEQFTCTTPPPQDALAGCSYVRLTRLPELRALLPSQCCFLPCQSPSLILGAFHSELPASHCLPETGKEMSMRNSGTEPPTAREMLTHSQCILTQENSRESQRALPGVLGALLSFFCRPGINAIIASWVGKPQELHHHRGQPSCQPRDHCSTAQISQASPDSGTTLTLATLFEKQ